MSQPHIENLISEEEFIPILNTLTGDFFRLVNLVTSKPTKTWAKSYYSNLSEKAHALESHLDEYHARYNKKFSYFTELFALIKWFGHCGFLQKHILIRLNRYPMDISDNLREEFIGESQSTLGYLNRCLMTLLHQLTKEARKLKLEMPSDPCAELISDDPYERRLLPQNIDEKDIIEQKHIIAELATLYKNVAESLRKIKVNKDQAMESIKNQTFYEFDETKTRQFESLIHNIQSKYDTYLRTTLVETGHGDLKLLRGHASLSLHLFEMATILVHIYERHENDIRYEKTKQKTCAVLPKQELLGVLNGYVRFYGVQVFLEGEKVADRIIEAFVKIQSIEINTDNRFALHARPLSLIAKIALHYNTPLEIEIEGHSCNAGSIMQMIMLAGNNPKPQQITFRGEDRALRDVKDLFESVLLQDGDLEKAPPHLSYLAK